VEVVATIAGGTVRAVATIAGRTVAAFAAGDVAAEAVAAVEIISANEAVSDVMLL
jgi:hypothetical protein